MPRRPVLLSAVLLALLAGGAVAADAGQNKTMTPTEKRKAKDELLASKLKLVEAAQRQHKDTKGLTNMTSDIVEEAPVAELWNGDADVSTVGACEQDIDWFCAKVEPGEGRLAACLSEQLEEGAAADTVGHTVSEGCYEELSAFMVDRATNINKDVPLARACRDDVKKHCSSKKYDRDSAADVLDCLRRMPKKKLSDKCARRVFEEEEEEAKDWRIDPGLHRKCAGDAAELCGDADPEEEGAVTQCLLDHIGQVSAPCVEELERVEEERAGDVRLDRPLFRACSADVRRFCEDEEWGDGKMEDCLQNHRYKEEFSERCRRALEARMVRESFDYELNYGLREYCEDDIDKLCKKEKDAIELREGFAADAQVITCLETKRTKIRGERCRQEVHHQMEHEAEDFRFDHELAKACHSDVRQHCKDVVPGSARVVGCLHEHRADLSKACTTKLFEHDERLAEDIDFKYPLHRACALEISIFCRDVPHGHALVVRCLQENIEDGEMSQECKAEVKKDEIQASRDYRLNYRLFKACSAEMGRLCAAKVKSCFDAGAECRGVVADCLRDRLDDIHGEECRAEVFHLLEMQVGDHQADPQLESACRGDMAMHCRDVEEAGAQVHDCLRQHWDRLSAGCKAQEKQLSILQARDVRLRPRLRAACSEELSVFCKGVEPGKARLYRCLMDNVGKGGFSEECKQAVLVSWAASQDDYRLNYDIGAACQADVDAQCKAEKQQLVAGQGHGVVLKCLVGRFKSLSEGCQNELSRGVRTALWVYKEGSPLTKVCDADVKARCPSLPRLGTGFFQVGAVGQCLSKQATQGGDEPLSPGCKELVLVAAPRDARAVFDSSMSLEAAATKVAQIAQAAGLSSSGGGPKGGGIGAITLTGWVAFAAVCALVLVVLGMLGFAVWRYLGAPGPRRHRYSTVVVKEGDV
ncbi:hypothetical protein ABPG75_011490 [Micractinium tetrahymenae]